MTMRRAAALLLLGALSKKAASQFNPIGGLVTNDNCDLAALQTRSTEVDLACCQGKGREACPAGTPTQCDLECALTYLPFYEDCQSMLMILQNVPTPTVIDVGSSGENDKEVPVSGIVSCESPAQPVNPQNPGWNDAFTVTLDSKGRGGQTITVHRTDSDSGWGQPLQITCTAQNAMAGLEQLSQQCEEIPVREALDMIDDLLGHCDMVAMNCDANGCRGGPPLSCAAVPGGAEGVTGLAELITIGEEVAYDGFCMNSVAGGGWTFVNEQGRSVTDTDDIFPEVHGEHALCGRDVSRWTALLTRIALRYRRLPRIRLCALSPHAPLSFQPLKRTGARWKGSAGCLTACRLVFGLCVHR